MKAVFEWFDFCRDSRNAFARMCADAVERGHLEWASTDAHDTEAWNWRTAALIHFISHPPEPVQIGAAS